MNDADFRLSKSVRPQRYDLRIEADLTAWRFRGTARIELILDAPMSEITLHAVGLAIEPVRASAGGSEQQGTVTFQDKAETVTLRFPAPLPAGKAQLDLGFSGEILERLRGFYRSTKDGERYGATQFEAADARRAFPCFDEPEFKARFALTLVVPSDATAISNGPVLERRALGDGRDEVRFGETPPISTYLVAWCIGPFEPTAEERTPSGVPVRVFLPRGMADRGLFARDAHVRSLAWLEDYTAIPYPYGKVDAIGVPDFEAGAMENPGAITYRLTAIAADAQRTSLPALKGIFYTAAHELTHMWWGDLVTMAWWDDLWLNESFATFVGYKASAELMPEWGLWRDFVASLTRPFALDSMVSTHPISFEVRNAKQATERFDVITYWKGAGVVRMIEGFLGADAFRSGVRAYLNRYREANARADDFWRELSTASGRDVASIANAWIRESGHPVVSVGVTSTGDGLKLQLRQQRFFADPMASKAMAPQSWPVPMVVKYGTETGVKETRTLLTATEGEVSLPGAKWFFPNGNASGFYRFALQEEAIRALAPNLQSGLEAHERLNLVDNQWALLKAGHVSLEASLALFEGLRGEEDRAVLAMVGDQLGWLGWQVTTEETRPAFEAWVDALFRGHFQRMGWDPKPGESADERVKRSAVLGALGSVARAADIRATARERFERYALDRNSLDPNLATLVVTLAARDGDAALYDRYLEIKRSARQDPEEEQRFLMALAAFEQPELVARTLKLAAGDEVRSQDRPFLFGALLGRRASRLPAWDYVRENWQEITRQMDPMLTQNLIRGLGFLVFEPVASAVREFLATHATDETRETVAQVSELLRIDAATVGRLQKTLAPALAGTRK